MEIEDMKTAWSRVEVQTGEQDVFSEQFIRNAITDGSVGLLGNMRRNYTFSAVAVGISALCALCICGLAAAGKIPLSFLCFSRWAALLLLVCLASELIRLKMLCGISIDGNVRDNLRRLARFDLYVRYEKTIRYAALPFLWLLVVRHFIHMGMPLAGCVCVLGLQVGLIINSVYYFRNTYPKNIGEIKKWLSELRDIEDNNS